LLIGGGKLFGGRVLILRQNFRYCGREVEAAAVGPVAESFDLGNAGDALLQQVVFERQIRLLYCWGNLYYRRLRRVNGRFRKIGYPEIPCADRSPSSFPRITRKRG